MLFLLSIIIITLPPGTIGMSRGWVSSALVLPIHVYAGNKWFIYLISIRSIKQAT